MARDRWKERGQAVFVYILYLLQSDSLSQHLTPVDKFVMLVAALSHKLCFTTEAHTVLSK